MSQQVSSRPVVAEGERRGLEFDKRRVQRTQKNQSMYPIVRIHTKEQMSATQDRKEKDTMIKEMNCNSNQKVHKVSSEELPKLEEIDDDEEEGVVRKISFKPLDF